MNDNEKLDLNLYIRIYDEMADLAFESSDEDLLLPTRVDPRELDSAASEIRILVHQSLEQSAGRPAELARNWGSGLQWDRCLAELHFRDLLLPSTQLWLFAAFVALPALVGLNVLLVLLAFGTSAPTAIFGAVAGALAALVGGLVCGASVNVVGASLGGIPVSWLLGFLSGILLDQAGGVHSALEVTASAAPVVAGLGGLSALLRPPPLAVGAVAISIFLLSVVMGVARSRAGKRSQPWTWAGLAKIVAIGVAGAGGPGLIFGICSLAGQGPAAEMAFATSLAVVGGSAFGSAALLRTGDRKRGLAFALAYAVLAFAIAASGFNSESATLRLLFATVVDHVLLQGTFFAFSYVTAERLAGPRGGIVASAVEGIPAYCIFILSRWL